MLLSLLRSVCCYPLHSPIFRQKIQPALWIPIPCGKSSQVSPGRKAQGPFPNTLPHIPEGARSYFPWTQKVRTVWSGEPRAGPQIGGICFLHQLNSMGVLHAQHTNGCWGFLSSCDLSAVGWRACCRCDTQGAKEVVAYPSLTF